MNANVNENCVGCGYCVGVCPEVFSLTDEGFATASADISKVQEDLVIEAADGCPVDAIEVEI